MQVSTRSARLLCIAVVVTFAAPAIASAAYIDFRDETYTCDPACPDGNPDGKEEAYLEVEGVTWTIVAKPAGAVLDWNDVDGFGNEGPGYEDDEIEEGEVLHIYFSEAVYVHQIHLTDFFYENGYLETGNYQVGDSAPVWFEANSDQYPSPQTNGEKWRDVNAWGTEIKFWAPGLVGNELDGYEDHEFAVAGLSVNPIPEPASTLLFGVGALIVGAASRKKVRGSQG